MNEAEGIEKIL